MATYSAILFALYYVKYHVTMFINTYLSGLVICMCTICMQGLKKLENGIESSGTEIDRPL